MLPSAEDQLCGLSNAVREIEGNQAKATLVPSVTTGRQNISVSKQQIPRCTVAKTLIIAKHYPTLASLMRAYKEHSSVKENEGLLKLLCDSNRKNKIGLALSRNIYHYLCDS